jgi:thioredoxin 1
LFTPPVRREYTARKEALKIMKYLSKTRWRPIALAGASILTVTLFSSCLSRDLMFKSLQAGQSETTKGELSAMKTLQSAPKIEHLSEASFNEKVLQSGMPVLVDFYAEWCGPCKALTPVLEEFANENPGVKIFKVNVDENHELAARYRIESIPSLLVFQNNELATRHMGLADKAMLKRLLVQ